MKIVTSIMACSVLSLAAGSVLPACGQALSEKSAAPLYIDNIHIVDINTGKIVENQQLQIINSKITAINPAGTLITDVYYVQHDGNGSYVSPGLIDMHVHAYDPAAFAIGLSYGVTHMRLLSGASAHLSWRKELDDGDRIGSTITVSSPIISGFKNATLHSSAQTPADARHAVIKAKQQGYDLIKAYGNLSAPVLAALFDEARKQNIAVAKHGPHPAKDMSWDTLTGLQSLEHVEDIYQGPLNYEEDKQKLNETIEQLKALDIPVTPTLNIFWQLTRLSDQKQTFIDSLPQKHISPIVALEAEYNQVRRWLNSSVAMAEHNKKTLSFLQEITRQLYLADVTLLVGSDSGALLSPHGFATHKEMELMQQAGLPALVVLRAATVNAANALGKASELGQVAVGYNADLVFSEKNPLDDLQTLLQPAAVIKHNRLISGSELEQLRQNAIDGRSFWQEMKTLLQAM